MKLNDNNYLSIIIFAFIALLIWFVAPSVISTIFNIGVEVGKALAKWF